MSIPGYRLLDCSEPSGRGFACGGHWVVDRTKLIDHYPEENSLAIIQEESIGGGGCAYNVIIDLAKFDPELPLVAAGVIGEDENGDHIMRECEGHPNIDLRFLRRTSAGRTAYTDAYAVTGGRSRTFFSSIGTNRLFDLDSVDFDNLHVWWFHLGYLTLFERLDEEDPVYGRVSARFLRELRTRGIHSSVDVVSLERADFADIVWPALRFADLLFINDFEAEILTGLEVRRRGRPSIAQLGRIGMQVMERSSLRMMVVHFPEGAFAFTSAGVQLFQPSLRLPEKLIRGTPGAGDAFCAGMLFGLYEGMALEEAIRAGVCAGGMSLFDLTTTGAIGPWAEVLALTERFPFRENEEVFSD